MLFGLNALQSQDTLTGPKLDLATVAQVNHSDSYITFPSDIGNLEPLMFEANVNPSFVIRKRDDSRLMGVLTPQIVIRMYNKESFPVRTPSFIPHISIYYTSGTPSGTDHLTLFWTLAHHSNGQDGEFYTPDGQINLKTGNFATNYIEFGLIKTSFSTSLNATQFLKSSLEIHPNSWMLEELKGQYSGLRWNNAFTAYKLPVKMGHLGAIKADFSLKIETNWFLDRINDWDFWDLSRLNARITFYYHPEFLEDIGLFVQYYHGMDYYNIYFNHRLDVVRFGIMTEVLRF